VGTLGKDILPNKINFKKVIVLHNELVQKEGNGFQPTLVDLQTNPRKVI
jgi:hypothetical protein